MKLFFVIVCFSILPMITFGQILNDGTLVKSEDAPEIYLVMNRHLHHIPTTSVFERLFIQSPQIKTVSNVSLEILPKGIPLKNGRLVQASNSAVFLQYDEYKVHIPNPETFNAYSFDWGKIVRIKDKEIAKYTTLVPIVSFIQPPLREEPYPCGTHD